MHSSMMHGKEHDAQELVPNLHRAAHHAYRQIREGLRLSKLRVYRRYTGLMNTAHDGGVGEPAFRHNSEDRALFRDGAIEPCEKLRV